ncbi:coiled-coil domain-containing protein 47-like [Pollicipes pollicipes]|uniref:coiled-coil domain-containing protein 47-like n=1 Tax=Pollicipes pollicipes TaxID=41117 RepID=UPI00188591E7|nr:coiled-coil domain-containing protein 47-like [Pollicipes pollicipes]XP_037089325.1 coiled-coil domain-containing protein 47-like [Pollicipes pollicipes]XP_037090474.1 coiled-coil domain-containing protein 47-like [Pollicipes pollicipes]XP_037090475.1 coiled-coil domain-containing protein 47-like [Pollicipes pollicipes]
MVDVRLKTLLVLLVLSLYVRASKYQAETEDNDFADFEEFDDDEFEKPYQTKEEPREPERKTTPSPVQDAVLDDDDGLVETEDEFEHFQDEEEFEGFESASPSQGSKEQPKITIANVPVHRSTNWDKFYVEMLMIAGIVVYFINFVSGKTRNQKLANAWLAAHKPLLESNFSLVGDDGKAEPGGGALLKESENTYTLWCSGRVCCEGMLVQLKFLKRQDLVSVMSTMMKSASDQVEIKVTMNPEEMDTFVFCLASKKSAAKLAKEMTDLNTYCPERKSAERHGLPAHFSLMSEIHEATAAVLDSRVTAVVNKYPDLVDFIHVSDQYSGPKQIDDSAPVEPPKVRPTLAFGFNLPGRGRLLPADVETVRPLMQLVLYMVDRMKRCKLGREARLKAEKNRLRVQEAYLKQTHQSRAEKAQAKREEKRRLEKERIMEEEDPEKQRRLEEKTEKREAKRRAQMRQMKVKAL